MSTSHFRLTTDLPADDARQTLAQLERLHAALLVGLRARGEANTGRVPVIALRQGWEDVAGTGLAGYFTQALFQPLIVLRAGATLENEEIIKHELVHFLSRKVIPNQPPWFSEGLASYLETIECPEGSDRVTIGHPSIMRMQWALRGGLYPIAELMAARTVPSEDRNRFYSTSWLLVHYLMNHHAAEMNAFVNALGGPPSPTPAWNRAFPTLTVANLEWDLRSYLTSGQYALLIYPFQAPVLAVTPEHLLSDADVHATRALLLAIAGRAGARWTTSRPIDVVMAQTAAELAEARRQEPAHVQAQAVAAWMLDQSVDLTQARAATQKQPKDWRAWLLLAQALASRHISEGQQAATDQALDLAAEEPSVALSISVHTPLAPVNPSKAAP